MILVVEMLVIQLDFQNIYAYDYSKSMLTKASKNIKDKKNITLSELDILKDDITTKADVALTKRMLINLGSFENQKKIHNDGYFIMLETSIDGLFSKKSQFI